MRGTRMLAMSLIALGTAIAPAGARASNLILNGSFENPMVSPGTFQQIAAGSSALTNWNVHTTAPNDNILLIEKTYSEPWPNKVTFNALDGNNAVDLTGNKNVGALAGISQQVATTIGELYTIKFWVGRATPATGPGGVYPGSATIDLRIGGLSTGDSVGTFTNSNTTNGAVNWEEKSFTFTAGSALTTIAFFNATPSGTNYAGLDKVSLSAVPEPASMALLGVGLGSLVIFRRRFAKRTA